MTNGVSQGGVAYNNCLRHTVSNGSVKRFSLLCQSGPAESASEQSVILDIFSVLVAAREEENTLLHLLHPGLRKRKREKMESAYVFK